MAAALVVYPVLRPSSLRGLFVFVGVVGVVVIVVAIVAAAPGLVGFGLLILLAEYAASLITFEQIDWGAPVWAAALLLLGDIAHGLAAAHRPDTAQGEALRTLAVAAVTLVSGYVVLAIVAIPLPHGELVQAVGAGAAAAGVRGLAGLARSRTGCDPTLLAWPAGTPRGCCLHYR